MPVITKYSMLTDIMLVTEAFYSNYLHYSCRQPVTTLAYFVSSSLRVCDWLNLTNGAVHRAIPQSDLKPSCEVFPRTDLEFTTLLRSHDMVPWGDRANFGG